jgi:hypothetical protein
MTTASRSFIPKRFRSNPLIMRTLRQPSKLRTVWWLISIVSLFSFIGTLFYKDTRPLLTVGLLEGLLLIVNPIFAAWTAANVICSEITGEQYELVMLTTLSNMKLVEGHVFVVFYRLRLPLILTLALLPSLVVRLTEYIYSNYYDCIRVSSDCFRTIVLGQSLYNSITVLAAIGVLIFGIVLATTLALWWRNQYVAGICALIIVIALIVLFFLLPNRLSAIHDPITLLIPTVPYTILLYVIPIAILLSAQCVARRRH